MRCPYHYRADVFSGVLHINPSAAERQTFYSAESPQNRNGRRQPGQSSNTAWARLWIKYVRSQFTFSDCTNRCCHYNCSPARFHFISRLPCKPFRPFYLISSPFECCHLGIVTVGCSPLRPPISSFPHFYAFPPFLRNFIPDFSIPHFFTISLLST
jgi:hypothetical protein